MRLGRPGKALAQCPGRGCLSYFLLCATGARGRTVMSPWLALTAVRQLVSHPNELVQRWHRVSIEWRSPQLLPLGVKHMSVQQLFVMGVVDANEVAPGTIWTAAEPCVVLVELGTHAVTVLAVTVNEHFLVDTNEKFVSTVGVPGQPHGHELAGNPLRLVKRERVADDDRLIHEAIHVVPMDYLVLFVRKPVVSPHRSWSSRRER